MPGKEDEENFDVAAIGGAHVNTILTAEKQIVPGHTSPATSETFFGGKIYDVSENLVQFDVSLAFLLFRGDDAAAELVIRNLIQKGMVPIITLIPGFRTASYTGFYDEDKFIAAIVKGIYGEVTVKMLAQRMSKLKKARTWIIDSEFSHEVNTYLAMEAAANGFHVYVVASALDDIENIEPLLGRSKALFVNRDELAQLTKIYDKTPEGTKRALEKVYSWGTEIVLACDGAKGGFAYANGQHYPIEAVKVEKAVNSHGAGGAFAAAVIAGLLQQLPLQKAIKLGRMAIEQKLEHREINAKILLQQLMSAATEAEKKKAKPKSFFKLLQH